MYDGIPCGEQRGKTVIPAHAEALSISLDRKKYAEYDVTLQDAIKYLRREVLSLPSGIPCGYVLVTYQGLPLGFVKNIGSRANNLYPKEWAIRMNVE